MSFSDLSLIPPLLRAVAEEGYTQPTPIQQRAIPHILAGRDLLGLAQTGTGKTAAFALPMLQRLSAKPTSGTTGRPVRALIITPTRELASQIGESFDNYGRHLGLTTAVIFGGVNARPQAETLKRGVDILVATPGRLLDHMQTRDLVRLSALEVFVLDEADRMLDMGFLPDVRRVIKALPAKRQNLFFSATMPTEVKQLSAGLLRDPAEVAVVPPATTAEKVAQSVYMIGSTDKKRLLVSLLADQDLARVLVFTRTKHGANRLVDHLKTWGTEAAVIHGNKSQSAREKALAGFKDGTVRVLVATDIAARGIDVDGVSHVVNYELPNIPESYVHRIGRTARAGASGQAIAFCAPDEKAFLKDIERAIRQKIPVLDVPGLPVDAPPPRPATTQVAAPQEQRRQGGGRGRSDGRRGDGSRQPAQPRPANQDTRGDGRGDGRTEARPAGTKQEARDGRSRRGRGRGNGNGNGNANTESRNAEPRAAQPREARPPRPRTEGATRVMETMSTTPRESVPSASGVPMVRSGPGPLVIRRLPGETLSGNAIGERGHGSASRTTSNGSASSHARPSGRR